MHYAADSEPRFGGRLTEGLPIGGRLFASCFPLTQPSKRSLPLILFRRLIAAGCGDLKRRIAPRMSPKRRGKLSGIVAGRGSNRWPKRTEYYDGDFAN